MLDRARQRAAAAAKSRRATPEDLREAGKRVKEIEQELLQLNLHEETKHGEERQQRYARMLRLRAMRDDFQAERPPLEAQPRVNSMLLALVMVAGAFLLTVFCAGGALASIQLLQQKPDPLATATGFWEDMQSQSYNDIQTSYLSPTLRVQYSNNQFVSDAGAADDSFGRVTGAVLIKKAGDQSTTAIFTYAVTRSGSKEIHYNATLRLSLHGTWGVDDLGAAIDPTQAGIPAPPSPSPTQPPDATPTVTDTPTGDRGSLPIG